jgi:flagellar biosynthesis protein FlhF
MRLRSFHGDTLSEAMRQVRDALGDDAIIVATRDDTPAGYRVTAAIDDSVPDYINEKRPEPKIEKPIDYGHDVVEVVAEHLTRHGVTPALAETLLSTVTHFADHDALIALGAAMDKHFRFAPLFETNGKPICLVGPPGAGKTLAVAKIATSRVMSHKNIGVITTDLVRAGAVEQLASLTRLLKLNLFEVEDAPALRDAVEAHPKGSFILIDSTGRNPFNNADLADLRKIITSADVEPVLVMPAGMDAMEAIDMAQAFMQLGARKLVLTKVDMTKRLGSMLALAHETGLQLCEMSSSPKATEALTPLNPVTFARMILPADVVSAALKSAKKAQSV